MTSASLVGDLAVSVHGLHKSYGELQAVRGIDLEIERGEIFALLGPNGAGKTTTIEILEGYRSRDEGEVQVLGLDPARQRNALKPHIGIVLQSTGVDRYLTVAETIAMYSAYYPHPRPIAEVIDVVGLEDKADVRVLKLSGGQQRRLDVAIALAGDPELLFLDEPTTGFDPSARRGSWEIVKNLAALGKTVLLTTHYMDEAQYLADRVAIIAAGRIVAEGPPASIAGRDRTRARICFSLDPNIDLVEGLGQGFASIAEVRRIAGRVEIIGEDLARSLHALTSWSIEHGVSLDSLEILRPSLEDIYLELIEASPSTPELVQ